MGRGLDLPERVVKLLRKQFPVCHMLSPYRNNSFPEGSSYETVFQGLQQTQAGNVAQTVEKEGDDLQVRQWKLFHPQLRADMKINFSFVSICYSLL